MWDPKQYELYSDERSRPFGDLVRRIGAESPSYVVDLGCGSGALTAGLCDRWPDATVLGVDSSAEMLAEAERHARPPRLSFRQGDVREFSADRPVDVLLTNAVLQWVPGHLDLLPGFVAALAPGGWLAIQVPGNFDSPTHTLLRELAAQPRWREPLEQAVRIPFGVEPGTYLERLAALGCRVDAWETTYLHVLQGADAVLEWVRGTALRPYLAALEPAAAEEFIAEYRALLRAAYPPQGYGTLLPFRRVFAVARAAR